MIITVAPTGSGPQWQKNPNVPITPEEIANEAVKAY
ncbi:MAG: 3-keto-5-aminohexanoate cleavage protein, partial [Candidatus Methanomethylicia archaeon]